MNALRSKKKSKASTRSSKSKSQSNKRGKRIYNLLQSKLLGKGKNAGPSEEAEKPRRSESISRESIVSIDSASIFLEDMEGDPWGDARSRSSMTNTSSSKSNETPEECFDLWVETRGYCTKSYKALETGYYNKPTDLQKASYHKEITKLLRPGHKEELEAILECGVSPNPCNEFGSSLIHNLCRQGCAEVLQTFVDHGCCLKVADEFGRTPLHNACWTVKPDFDLVKIILRQDRHQFFMEDARGNRPLSYVPKHKRAEWITFLEANLDSFWPDALDPTTECIEDIHAPPALAQQGPNTRPLSDPSNAAPIEVAKFLVSRRIDPEEVKMLLTDGSWDEDDSEFDSSEEGSSDYEISESCTDYEEEMSSLLNMLPVAARRVATATAPSKAKPLPILSSHRMPSSTLAATEMHQRNF